MHARKQKGEKFLIKNNMLERDGFEVVQTSKLESQTTATDQDSHES